MACRRAHTRCVCERKCVCVCVCVCVCAGVLEVFLDHFASDAVVASASVHQEVGLIHCASDSVFNAIVLMHKEIICVRNRPVCVGNKSVCV